MVAVLDSKVKMLSISVTVVAAAAEQVRLVLLGPEVMVAMAATLPFKVAQPVIAWEAVVLKAEILG